MIGPANDEKRLQQQNDQGDNRPPTSKIHVPNLVTMKVPAAGTVVYDYLSCNR